MQTEAATGDVGYSGKTACRLSVILVSYNVRYFLEQALHAVRRASRGLEVEVFVVDNHSADDSVAMVRATFPEVRLIVNTSNRGFAVANNQAIRQSRSDYILLLNPDTVVEENAFTACLDYMDAHPKAGALGVKMIDGSGAYLPESKRGFPSPWVAFCKTVGLSRLFPRSRLFNGYHLGFLDPDEIHEVDVLAGAFLLLRREVLEKCGLLDERFFMYGEDIDLSYRIQQAGYANIYFPKTRIIHYKGESTRKGSLSYVRSFYSAMVLFARKHFRGRKAWLYILFLQLGIYLQAGLTLLRNLARRFALPVMDSTLIYAGLLVLKDFWATYHFHDPDYYAPSFLYINAPLYTLIWVASIFFSGAYDVPDSLRRLLRGLLVGTLLLAAVYGFLDLEYRTSRALIVLGALWASLATVGLRMLRHFIKYGNFAIGRDRPGHLVIVGSREESARVGQLLRRSGANKHIIGSVAPSADDPEGESIGVLEQLQDIVHIYQVSDIVFCSRDLPVRDITYWMTRLGPGLHYRIVPENSLGIIGSSSRNSPGELYTIEVQFAIAQSLQRRNKRLLDLGLALFFILTLPLHGLWIRPFSGFLSNLGHVLSGKMSWVGYGATGSGVKNLPPLRQGVLNPGDALRAEDLDGPTRARLDLLYARDYTIWRDLDLLWKGRNHLGRPAPRV